MFPASATAEGAQFNVPPFPASATAEGRQLNGAPFPATAWAEGAQFNVPPFPASATAEGRQFNGAPSPGSGQKSSVRCADPSADFSQGEIAWHRGCLATAQRQIPHHNPSWQLPPQ